MRAKVEDLCERIWLANHWGHPNEHGCVSIALHPGDWLALLKALQYEGPKVKGPFADALVVNAPAPGVKVIEGKAEEVASETVERGTT